MVFCSVWIRSDEDEEGCFEPRPSNTYKLKNKSARVTTLIIPQRINLGGMFLSGCLRFVSFLFCNMLLSCFFRRFFSWFLFFFYSDRGNILLDGFVKSSHISL